MRRLVLVSAVVAATSAAFAIATPTADAAAPHGCVAVSGVVTVASPATVLVAPDCSFPWQPLDTYSGLGPFSLSCPLYAHVHTISHAATDPPAVQATIVCDVDSPLTVHADPGGLVAAGSAM